MKLFYFINILLPGILGFNFNNMYHNIGPGIENIHHKKDIYKPGVFIVKQISSILPHVDSIGHDILHANNEFINDVLNNPLINEHYKKDIILFSIKLAQHGDEMGSQLLQVYYNIVEKSL